MSENTYKDFKSEAYGSTKGYKLDGGKARFDLIPPEAEQALAEILTLGAQKYDARNWEGGMSWQRVYASLRRHLNAWESGEDVDSESGQSHLAHALTNVAFLVTYERRNMTEHDDRPAFAQENALEDETLNKIQARLAELHKERHSG